MLSWYEPFGAIISGEPGQSERQGVAVWEIDRTAQVSHIPDILANGFVKVV